VQELIQEQQQELDDKGQILIVQCHREEAEFISAYGISGIILPINKVTITGRVTWDDMTIQRERENYTVIDNYPIRFTLSKHEND
jgi:hypothetical protein